MSCPFIRLLNLFDFCTEPSNEGENGNKIIDMDTDEQMMSTTKNSVN